MEPGKEGFLFIMHRIGIFPCRYDISSLNEHIPHPKSGIIIYDQEKGF